MWTLQCDVELKRMSIRNSNDWEILNRNHETAEIRQINIQDSHIRIRRNDWTLSWMYQRTCRRKTSDWISAKIYQEIFEFVVCLDSWMNQHKPQAWRKKTRETFDVLECIIHSESMVVIRPYWLRPFYFIIKRQMKIEEIKIEKLIPYEFNNKIHWENQINRIANSIKELWFLQPIVIDKQNIVIVWHWRLEWAKKLWLETVPCVRVENLTEQQIKKYRILDNRLNESEYDLENLQAELSTLDDFNFWDLEIDINEEFDDLFPEEWNTQFSNNFENKEIDEDDLWWFEHKCPKCWFEFNSSDEE